MFRRIYERELPFSMITSFGVLIGGVGVVKYFWGLVPRPVPVPIDAQVFIFGTEIPVYRLVVVAIAALVYVGIWLFLNKTIVGKAIRAGIENVEHVEGLGINVSRLFTLTFIIAGGLSGLAGGLHAPLIMVEPQMGLEVLAFAFMVVIIGGLGSIKGTLVSSFLVGQVVSIGSLIYAPLAAMAPFAIMLLILLVMADRAVRQPDAEEVALRCCQIPALCPSNSGTAIRPASSTIRIISSGSICRCMRCWRPAGSA